MLITIQTENDAVCTSLPEEVRGAHWLMDAQGKDVALAEAEGDQWAVSPGEGMTFASAGSGGRILISMERQSIHTIENGEDAWTLVCRPSTDGDKTTRILGFSQDREVSIGRSSDNDIVYPSEYVSARHGLLLFSQGSFSIVDLESSNGVFLNGSRIPSDALVSLQAGDVVLILGLRMTVGDRFISVNCPEDALLITDSSSFVAYEPPEAPAEGERPKRRRDLFYPALRFARSVERTRITIDPPPQNAPEDDAPLIMRVGPSLVMGFAALFSAAVSATFWMGQGSGSVLRAVPMVVMAFAMLTGSALWPVLNRRFQKRRSQAKEVQRKNAYAQYLGKVRMTMRRAAMLQKEILEENRISPQACLQAAREQDERFMARTPLHGDYLEIRLGRGDVPLEMEISFPERRFDGQEDALREVVDRFAREPHGVCDVPIGHSFIDRPFVGIVGSRGFTDGFLRNILIQICVLHAPTDVKVAVLNSAREPDPLKFTRYLPHQLSDDRTVRLYAEGLSEANAIGMTLEKLLEERRGQEGRAAGDRKPFVVIFCPSKEIYDRAKIVQDVLALHENLGFALIACAEQMHELPLQCHTIIGEAEEGAYLLRRDDPSGTKKPFMPDEPISAAEAQACVLDIARARLDVTGSDVRIPDRCSFMQLFGATSVEHLNIEKRWCQSNASVSLAAPVGMDAAGEPFVLDIHEDFHGPHGLIAGTTGSGKSEFIITYVLSMALTYPPDEVAFVLIDYKGGGLARAFDNDRFQLPHIAGTITNLDGSAIARSLVSIKSELRHRQRLFNEARELIGGDSVDISIYLDLYRQGKVSEPCPHLIVIADEFAELKQQEPAFMDELISASRIGRSLGVHLILATQKPSGVVNDQIWSNARFKASLKVADAADSMEIIKRPDAAKIIRPGRFFLLVGCNELFDQGQSGYAGAPYLPGESFEIQDKKVSCISNTGRVLLSVEPEPSPMRKAAKTQLVAAAEYIVDAAAVLGKHARPLWLPPIPAHLVLEEIEAEFGWEAHDDQRLEPAIGLYDDPAEQAQGLLSLPMMEEGNAVIYGSADAGVEQAIRTAVFSALRSHSARTLHSYLLDFGSGSLAAFADAPQVGDVVLTGEDEKVRRFFACMKDLVARRRALFAPYGGSFTRYRTQSEGCPAILVILNGVGAFLEAYPEYEEDLTDLARDSLQAGIFLILVGESPHAVRMRMRGFFRQVIACDLPDPADLVMLFGSLHGMAAPHGYGRGLARKDDRLFEFQTAHLRPESESEHDFIMDACVRWSRNDPCGADAAPALPQAPDGVSASELASFSVGRDQVPFGVFDDTLEPAAFDFGESALARCVSLKMKTMVPFLQELIAVSGQTATLDVALLDMAQVLKDQPQGCVIATRKDGVASRYLASLMTEGAERKTVIFITGIVGFLGRCAPELAGQVKGFIKRLNMGGKMRIVLFDVAVDATYAHEDWFRAHLSGRNGLWVGPGITGQSAISVAYDKRILPDVKMDERMGYAVEGGAARLVHIAGKGEKG